MELVSNEKLGKIEHHTNVRIYRKHTLHGMDKINISTILAVNRFISSGR